MYSCPGNGRTVVGTQGLIEAIFNFPFSGPVIFIPGQHKQAELASSCLTSG